MPKILLSGAVGGRWEPLLARVGKLNAASKGKGGAFELLVAVGGALPFPRDVLSGERPVPVPIYVLPGVEPKREELGDEQQRALFDRIQQAAEDGDGPVEIAPNCFVLAGKGVATVGVWTDWR